MAVLRLIRIPNLLIVAVTQAILYFHLLLPCFRKYDLSPTLSPDLMVVFIMVTVLLTAGGYVINDLMDYNADLINKPEKVVVNRTISRQSAVWLYFCSNLIGFFLALYLAFRVQPFALVNLFPLAGAGLFLYSYHFKRRPLSGNLLIALYCSAVAGIIWFAEREAIAELLAASPETVERLQFIFAFYLGFAFLSTLFRELVKDLEDLLGDQEMKYKTAPIVWGITTTRNLAQASAAFLFLLLVIFAYFFYQQLTQIWSMVVLLLILLPLAFSMFLLQRASDKKAYHQVSQLIKWIMLGGLLLLLFL